MLRLLATWWLEVLKLGMPITWPNKRKNRRQRNETNKEEKKLMLYMN